MYILEYWNPSEKKRTNVYDDYLNPRDIYRSDRGKRYEIIRSNMNGNCLFESLFNGLLYIYPKIYDQTPYRLRKLIIKNITMDWYRKATNKLDSTLAFDSQFITSKSALVEDRETYSAPLSNLYNKGLTARYLSFYRQFMGENGVYGTAIEIMSFTYMYSGVQVIVRQLDVSIPKIYFYDGCQYDTGVNNVNNIDILWTGGNHYEFLRPLDECYSFFHF
jgi:hypothetical protein